MYNQSTKYRTIKRARQWEQSLVDFIEKSFTKKNRDYMYTAALISRLKKYFDNVTIMNFHDKSKDFSEYFFCDAIPGAKHTCQFAKNDEETHSFNLSVDLAYGNLAFAARKMGLLKIANDTEMKIVSAAVQNHHEQTLGLTRDDFKLKCPSAARLQQLLKKSLKYEKKVFPQLDEDALKSDFKNKSTTVLCDVDTAVTLKMPEWQTFFKSLKVSIRV
mmetsp:Transcript_28236/g.56588  ORF Transcript_28236/g.56588 Transcript_28236/m.56588 type:complete len:217 (+) Transcript_28236:679-1329(+)